MEVAGTAVGVLSTTWGVNVLVTARVDALVAVLGGAGVAVFEGVFVTARVGILVEVLVAAIVDMAKGVTVIEGLAATTGLVEMVAVRLIGSTTTYPLVKSRRQAVPVW